MNPKKPLQCALPSPRLDLVVGAVPLVALAALEQVRLGALHLGQLGGVDALLHKLLSLTLHLEKRRDPGSFYYTTGFERG